MTKIQLKRSSALNNATTSRAPGSAQLDYGELAINYNSADPQLFIKDSSGSVIRILDSYAKLAGTTFTGDVNFDGNVKIKGDSTNGAGKLSLSCETDTYTVNIKAPPTSATASYTLTLPTSAGSNSQVLTTDGSGNLSWALSSMSTADKTKLDGIETGATADQTSAEIKSLYESEADTNAFTDALLTKLNNIASGAQVNPTVVSAFTNDAGYITSADGGNAQTLDGLDSTQFARSDAKLENTAGAKLEIQNAIEGGPNHGIYFWQTSDTNWVHYMSTSGSGKTPLGGTACTSIDGRTLHHLRYRVYAGGTADYGFIWENHNDICLMSLTSDSGKLYVRGDIYAGNSTTNRVWHAGDRAMYLNAGASGSYGNEITVGNSSPQFTLRDTNLRPIIQATGQYPCLSLNHTATTNTNHGPTIQFIHNGYDSNEQIVVGTTGQGRWLDVGFSGGGYGTNTDYNPHNGISGYSGITPVRVFSNGVLVGATGSYPNHVQSISLALDVRGAASASSDMRAPIFYDSNNTTFYCDPAGTSSFHKGEFRGFNGSTTTGNQVSLEIENAQFGTGDNGVAAMSFHCYGYYAMHMHLRHDSYFGIGGWSASAWRWYVQMSTGNMTAAGSVTANSDIRLKEEIEPLHGCLDKLIGLNGVSFRWKDIPDVVGSPGKKDFGIIAQEVEKVFPEVVHESAHESPDGDKYKTVAYDRLMPVLIEAVKELKNNFDDLTAELNSLKACL